MIINEEWAARIKTFFRFSKEELISLGVAIFVGGFLFSLQFPEEVFTFHAWIYYFILALLVSTISFFWKVSTQKMEALKHGYYAEFHVIWVAVAITLLIGILSRGYLPILFLGVVSTSFMVRQRLGEFRYGYSFEDNSRIIKDGIITNLVAATVFAFGAFMFPGSFFFETGIIFNLVLALCTILPIPRLDGMTLLFGSKFLFFLSLGAIVLYSILLLSSTKIGLVIAITIGVIAKIISLLWTA